MKMKAVLLTVGSFILTAGVISNAYIQKKQFYPSVVFITKSSPSMAVLYMQAFVFVVLMWKLMRKMFFGQLRAAEMEHLIERSWYAVTETCLAFTVFRDDFSPRFVALFTLLLFIKCFHWLGEDRVDYMERSPVISLLFHMRVLSLLTVLGMMDAYFINHAYYSTLIKGASVQLVFGFEYAILLTVVLHIFIKYVLHAIDLQSENPWDNKAVYLLYTELLLGLIKVVLYMLFLAIMIKVHTFPLFAIRPMYLTMRTFKKAFNDVIMSRRAIRNMNTLYPNATAEELAAGDNVCIICREEMVAGNCKKLPCNHIFHSSCLRSWFQRQQTCPTCRMDVLRPPAPATPAPAPAAPAAQGPAQQQQQQQQQQPMAPMFPGFPPMFPAQAPPPTPPAASAATTTASGTTSSSAVPPPMSPPFMMPPMPFMMPPSMPFMGPMPSVPADLSSLSEVELAAMEGTERANVEARIQWLRNIHTLLDTAMAQLNQYSLVMASAAATQRGPSTSSANTTTVTATKTAPTPAETVTSTSTKESSAAEKGAAAAAAAVEESLEGAVGGVEPSEPANPLADPPPPASRASHEDDGDERSEIRRRRLERFSSSTSGGTQDKDNGASAGDASSAKQRTGGGNLDIAVD